jgi:hypothetical protein
MSDFDWEIGAQEPGQQPSQAVANHNHGIAGFFNNVLQPPLQQLTRSVGTIDVPVNARKIGAIAYPVKPPGHYPQGPVAGKKSRDEKDRLSIPFWYPRTVVDWVAQQSAELEHIVGVRSYQAPGPSFILLRPR